MIVYTGVYMTRSRKKIAEYALPFHKVRKQGETLDYEFIGERCDQIVQKDIIAFDNNCHQYDSKETKDLFYFFKYIKKNLYLVAALDRQFAFYEDELKDQFMKLHADVQRCAQSNFMDGMTPLVNALTLKMAESMRKYNPACKEEMNMKMIFDDELTDTESNNMKNISSSSLSEIELQNVNTFVSRRTRVIYEDTKQQLLSIMTWFNYLTDKEGGRIYAYYMMVFMIFIIMIMAYIFHFNIIPNKMIPGQIGVK